MFKFAIGTILTGIVLGLSSCAAWMTHIIWCIRHHEYVLLLVGAIAAPIGVIHGFGIWFGFWV